MLRSFLTCKIKLGFNVATFDCLLAVLFTPCSNIDKRIAMFRHGGLYHFAGLTISAVLRIGERWGRGEQHNPVSNPFLQHLQANAVGCSKVLFGHCWGCSERDGFVYGVVYRFADGWHQNRCDIGNKILRLD